ncbi:type II toxin-antitoxin system RelE/ParE family toxin [Urbifossiella limnaea]|uniref:Plasmid stabilization system protein n=1 Tax=Urbifossiella limnaea TaxID=2528023 RepID=A0A517XY12_9BACT|nr:type II toxin-antitoxin system RelE/ParE family toxin [Urbifossiella limnaea]QDU22399.1 Plasmid stabilization system protein [Urbifossiella limnaea]
MTYRFLDVARADLDDAAAWYEARQAGLGGELIDEVHAAVSRVLAMPLAYPKVAGCPRGREVRVVVPHRYDFLVVYEATASEVIIISVTHGRSARHQWRQRLP